MDASHFVVANGSAFALNGQPFEILGANNYYLGFAPDAMVRSVIETACRMKLNVLRTWAFLDCGPGSLETAPAEAKYGAYFQFWNAGLGRPEYNDGSTGLELLDRTIAWADEAGIRLILPLVNYWDDFGGVDQYLRWFGLSGRDRFYREPVVKEAYRRYVEHLLLRVNTRTGRLYRDEPAILAWELANEPRCVGLNGGRLANGVEALGKWVEEMSSFLKSLDPNHLVGIGDEGYFRRHWTWGKPLYDGSFGVDWERFLQIPTIDFGTCHLYPKMAAREDPKEFGARWIREHIEAGHAANKPVICEEYGTQAVAGLRDDTYEYWLNQVSACGGAGSLLWMLAGPSVDGQLYPDYDGYTVYSEHEVPSIVARTRSDSAESEGVATRRAKLPADVDRES